MPRVIVTLLLDDTRPPSGEYYIITSKRTIISLNRTKLTNSKQKAIETYFARSLGLSLLTITLLTVMLSGSVPLSSALTEPIADNDKDAVSDPRAPYAMPTLIFTTIFHSVCAFYAYTWFASTTLAAFAVGMGGHAIVAALGVWCALFAGSHVYGRVGGKGSAGVSGVTGGEKRTAGVVPVNKVNVEAEKEKEHIG